jgi:hypothetical protein
MLAAQIEVRTGDFYSAIFYPVASKIHTSIDVAASAGLSCTMHAQCYDCASEDFYTVWSEAAPSDVSRSVIFTDVWWVAPGLSVFVMTTPKMRWWAEMSGTGAIMMSISVFELNPEGSVG